MILDSIESEVRKALTRVAGKWQEVEDPDSDAGWTRAIKNAVGAVGRKCGYEIYSSESDFEENGEWLYDMCWLIMDGDRLRDVPLVLECEWTPRGTLEDFQKLLQARTRRRVMIHWAPNREAARRCIEVLIEQVRVFALTQPGDRYLFACYLGDADEFLFAPFVAGS